MYTTFAEMRRSNYSCFADTPEAHRKASIRHTQQIEQLAGLIGIDLSDKKIGLFFKENGDLLDMKDVNSILFSMDKPREEKDFTEEEKLLLENQRVRFSAKIENQVRRFEDDSRSYLSNARGRYRDYEECLKHAYNLFEAAKALKGKRPDMIEEIDAVKKANFFKITGISGDLIYWQTLTDISMSLKSKAMNIDMTVNFGKLNVVINVANISLRVNASDTSLLHPRGYYHPYISDSGTICWGNMADKMTTLLARGEIAEVMNYLSALLTTYSPDATPYIALEDFYSVQMAKMKGEPPVRICSRCDELESECDCFRCNYCDFVSAEYQCEDHWCSHCDEYHRNGNCWCSTCDNAKDDCECCPHCGEGPEDCDHCRECGRSDGEHRDNCSERPEEEER